MIRPQQKHIYAGQWWDRSVEIMKGCTPVSTGCLHCWHRAMALRFGWDGTVRFREDRVDRPLHARLRRVWTWWGDVFHPAVTKLQHDRLFGVMLACATLVNRRQDFILLTKRPDALFQYVEQLSALERLQVSARAVDGLVTMDDPETLFSEFVASNASVRPLLGPDGEPCAWEDVGPWGAADRFWPLPNLMLATSAENQATLDERLPHLLATPAAYRGLSLEPLLERVDVSPWLDPSNPTGLRIDWVIVGAETRGLWAGRPCKTEWIIDVVEQCRAAGVPCWVKGVQIGKRVSHDPAEWPKELTRLGEMREWIGE